MIPGTMFIKAPGKNIERMYFHAFYSLLNAATEVATFCIELLQ
jgi:hypothetical protein